MRLALLLLLVASAAAQTPAGTSEKGRIEGVVTEADTGLPLVGATVRVVGTERGAVADLDGRFEIDRLPARTVRLQADFPGYHSADVQVTIRPCTTTTWDVALSTDLSDLDCIIACGLPSMMGRGVYAARVTYTAGSFDCCDPTAHPIYPAFVRWEDR